MRPQDDEPCVDCKKWSNKTGCKEGHYNSAAMVIFGACAFCTAKKKKIQKPEEVAR